MNLDFCLVCMPIKWVPLDSSRFIIGVAAPKALCDQLSDQDIASIRQIFYQSVNTKNSELVTGNEARSAFIAGDMTIIAGAIFDKKYQQRVISLLGDTISELNSSPSKPHYG